MRRTESRDALQGQVCVGTFVWDADEDGPIPAGTSYLRGAVPEDSIAFGGYLYVTRELETEASQLELTIAHKTATLPFPIALGWHRVNFEFETVALISRVDTEVASRLRLDCDSPVLSGQLCLHVFYVYSEGRQPDIEGPFPPEDSFLLLDDDVFYVLLDNDLDKIIRDI